MHRYANTGLNTFLFAMTSLELKHRAPKVITVFHRLSLFLRVPKITLLALLIFW